MIERYSRPGMKRVWSEENKFQKWLDVEIAACEAWAQLGVIPRAAGKILHLFLGVIVGASATRPYKTFPNPCQK